MHDLCSILFRCNSTLSTHALSHSLLSRGTTRISPRPPRFSTKRTCTCTCAMHHACNQTESPPNLFQNIPISSQLLPEKKKKGTPQPFLPPYDREKKTEPLPTNHPPIPIPIPILIPISNAHAPPPSLSFALGPPFPSPSRVPKQTHISRSVTGLGTHAQKEVQAPPPPKKMDYLITDKLPTLGTYL